MRFPARCSARPHLRRSPVRPGRRARKLARDRSSVRHRARQAALPDLPVQSPVWSSARPLPRRNLVRAEARRKARRLLARARVRQLARRLLPDRVARRRPRRPLARPGARQLARRRPPSRSSVRPRRQPLRSGAWPGPRRTRVRRRSRRLLPRFSVPSARWSARVWLRRILAQSQHLPPVQPAPRLPLARIARPRPRRRLARWRVRRRPRPPRSSVRLRPHRLPLDRLVLPRRSLARPSARQQSPDRSSVRRTLGPPRSGAWRPTQPAPTSRRLPRRSSAR
jgi:hypothetical protein